MQNKQEYKIPISKQVRSNWTLNFQLSDVTCKKQIRSKKYAYTGYRSEIFKHINVPLIMVNKSVSGAGDSTKMYDKGVYNA